MNSVAAIGRLTEPEAPGEQVDLDSAAPDPLTIGRRVRHVRQEAGRTLGDVADAIGISASALSLIETGNVSRGCRSWRLWPRCWTRPCRTS